MDMIYTDKNDLVGDYPHFSWLLDADIADYSFEIVCRELVWHYGIWYGGIWHDGVEVCGLTVNGATVGGTVALQACARNIRQ